MERRRFLKQSGILAAASGLQRFMPVAGPFTINDFANGNIPEDKKLDKNWIKSLYERGSVTSYSKTKNELRYIGMPAGGICCGTVYVGGDGRLWVWDIFNQNQLGAVNKTLPIQLEGFNAKEINNIHGTLYLEPAVNTNALQQGIALIIRQKNDTITKRLHQDDWDEIIFEATYPIATIRYIDQRLPVEVMLQAFSPFIAGDADNSGLPATIQSVSVKNLSSEPLTVHITGWLENKILQYTQKEKTDFKRANTVLKDKHIASVFLGCTTQNEAIKTAADFGNMTFATLDKSALCTGDITTDSKDTFQIVKNLVSPVANAPIAAITSTHVLKENEAAVTDFIISWFMPNASLNKDQLKEVADAASHYYASRFESSTAVANHIAQRYPFLKEHTLLWRDTWYDSTLPYWFLDRTFLNISALATTTSHRFKSGRFYAWEGVGCCYGTCNHVYQYAHAMSRIFPELERDTRERVDLGISFDEATGMIRYRGEGSGPSIDGQAGTVLRIYREYLMQEDDALLKNNWPKIKKAVSFIIAQDKNKDGMEDTPLENTLDALWSGEISWIVGLCIAAVSAGEQMAKGMEDTAFAAVCRQYTAQGSANMESQLFNGEYFIHRPDPKVGKKEIGSYDTCHIDQVYGQSWAWQAGLGRILSKEKTMSALQALWKYNYMPDVGPYIKEHPGGRFYALAGEGGLVMNTNPHKDDKPYGEAKAWQIGYFSECMTGFEHQVASHMMAEGMIEESLVITRTIHDRYHAFKRNPFNEIECSDHYARAMASYGTFLSACGFEYDGPKGYIQFAPKWNKDNFKAPFTAAKGWGSYLQSKQQDGQTYSIIIKYGHLKLNKISVTKLDDIPVKQVVATAGKERISLTYTTNNSKVLITFAQPLLLQVDKVLKIFMSKL
ncbi:hypothetical protein FC093_03120 [Ilyomonas limi]|uniref:Twin-arginine translocation signal domain-containing protein n=1 Tax=Ilyomonas limi TaxID=2575867 RepID=A0A4U3LDJ6_9BACT|nr:GH116 family glycosyl hydrolase [Ilyomonas limi]TKK72017.1 hypothetical protein FC093_03120 [Ilyomonas limi]